MYLQKKNDLMFVQAPKIARFQRLIWKIEPQKPQNLKAIPKLSSVTWFSGYELHTFRWHVVHHIRVRYDRPRPNSSSAWSYLILIEITFNTSIKFVSPISRERDNVLNYFSVVSANLPSKCHKYTVEYTFPFYRHFHGLLYIISTCNSS